MPNYVTNRISFTGNEETIDLMLESIKNDTLGKGTIDFMKIAPRPAELDIEAGSSTYRGMKYWTEFLDLYATKMELPNLSASGVPKSCEEEYLKAHPDIDREDWDLGKKATINVEKYGASDWYMWNISNKNWGTKWNACGYEEGVDYSHNDELVFDTAWSAPHPILEKLAALYPEITFTHEFSDEDLGQNCGMVEYKNGKRVKAYIPIDEEEALRFACKVHGYDYDEIKTNY